MDKAEFEEVFFDVKDDGCADIECEGCQADFERVWSWLEARAS